ncbi:MAG: response regulator [Peptococcaceae bacterium]|jgi:putative two-component system response regulator|nr:response regulator [Peptococcaceae bacterium]
MQKTIFVIDDNDTNLSVAEEALEEQYRLLTLPSGDKMFTMLERVTPDLILLDIEMPEMDGFEALLKLKATEKYADIPVIFLTSMTDAETEAKGFQLGVIDFITKPFSVPVLINRIKTHLNIDELIRERTSQIQRLKNAIVFSFADFVEKRDEGTGGHIERTSEYIRILINAMITRGIHDNDIRNMDIDSLIASARLHDVGKVSISDVILNKPGKLTDEEFEIMKTHTTEGETVIETISARTDDDGFLRNAKLFAGSHHERWDGKGYPRGLMEEDIPLQGRVMAIVDVYDALVSERPYKKPFSEEQAVGIIMEEAGKQFDPYISNVFYEVKSEFSTARRRLEGV